MASRGRESISSLGSCRGDFVPDRCRWSGALVLPFNVLPTKRAGRRRRVHPFRASVVIPLTCERDRRVAVMGKLVVGVRSPDSACQDLRNSWLLYPLSR